MSDSHAFLCVVPQFLAEGAALLAPLVLFSNEAAAKGGEYGVLEGRSVALVHPIMMGTKQDTRQIFTYIHTLHSRIKEFVQSTWTLGSTGNREAGEKHAPIRF